MSQQTQLLLPVEEYPDDDPAIVREWQKKPPKRVEVKFCARDAELIDRLITEGHFATRSEFVRECVRVGLRVHYVEPRQGLTIVNDEGEVTTLWPGDEYQ